MCGKGDSNSHTLSGATTSKYCVYQFRHRRICFKSPAKVKNTCFVIKIIFKKKTTALWPWFFHNMVKKIMPFVL